MKTKKIREFLARRKPKKRNHSFLGCSERLNFLTSERFPSVSIIIPAHNEEKRIAETLKDYGNFFSKIYKKDFEMIVVLNGCSDNTLGIIKKAKKKYLQIKYLDFRQAGKGFAIIEGFKIAKGDLIGFTDADNATNAEEFNKLVEKIGGYGGIIASRYIRGAVVEPKQPYLRRVASRVFNFLVRALFGLKVNDTQCGAKLFKKEAVKKVLPKLGITKWAFDVDLLFQMKKAGLKVKEMPTIWKDVSGSRLNVSKASYEMLLAVARLRLMYSPFKFIVRFYDILPGFLKIHQRLR